MERLEDMLLMIDASIDTKKKRHIVGGVLMSISLFFGGLAITVLALKNDYIEDGD